MFVEREKGCSFADQFRSSAEVVHNGATVIGNPVFDMTNGVTYDGVGDALIYNLSGDEFNSSSLTVALRFSPDFDYDFDSFVTLLEAVNSSGTDTYYIQKGNNAGLNRLRVYLNDVFIADVPVATWSPNWNVGSENILVLSSTSGDTSMWLNGVSILASDPSVWTNPANTIKLAVGSSDTGGNRFIGTIHDIKIYKSKLTDQECLDLSNGVQLHHDGTVQGFVDDSTCALYQEYRQQVATDYSLNSNDGTLTATHYTGRGLGFPASTSVNTVADDATIQLTDGAIVVLLDVIAQTADKRLVSKVDAGGTNYDLYTSTTGLVFHDGTNARTRAVVLDNGINCIGVNFETGEKCEAFVKGASVGLFNDTSTITKDDAPLLIGNHYGDSKQIESALLAVLIFNRALTAAEMAAVYADLMY